MKKKRVIVNDDEIRVCMILKSEVEVLVEGELMEIGIITRYSSSTIYINGNGILRSNCIIKVTNMNFKVIYSNKSEN